MPPRAARRSGSNRLCHASQPPPLRLHAQNPAILVCDSNCQRIKTAELGHAGFVRWLTAETSLHRAGLLSDPPPSVFIPAETIAELEAFVEANPVPSPTGGSDTVSPPPPRVADPPCGPKRTAINRSCTDAERKNRNAHYRRDLGLALWQ